MMTFRTEDFRWYSYAFAIMIFILANQITLTAMVRCAECDRFDDDATFSTGLGDPQAARYLVAGQRRSERETRPKVIPELTVPVFEDDPVAVDVPKLSVKQPAVDDESAHKTNTPKEARPPWQENYPSRFLPDDPDFPAEDSQNGTSEKFHWKKAILQSLLIQGFQHTYAIAAQEKTRRGLKGPFFRDWFDSVKNLHGWDDGNRFFTNYIAHPMQGAMTGFIFLQNHDRLKKQKFAESKTYWADRLKAMLWSAAWSTQWEIGPMSQASIGNVGLNKKGMAYVDLVMTPTAGTGWMMVEEALDRYVIRHMEEGSGFFMKMVLRTILNPMRSVANVLRFKEPWYRDRPFGH